MDQDIEATMPPANDDLVTLFSGDLLSEFKMWHSQAVTMAEAERRDALESEILRRLRLAEPPRFT